MALRGKVPSSVQKRLKMMLFGVAGCGKTTCALQFPKPYLIDTERGAENDQYIKALEAQGGVIFQTSDFDEMVKEIRSLMTEKHEYKTLIIDPITVVYNNLLEVCAKEIVGGKPRGESNGRHYGEANKRMASLFNMIMKLDMNVIFTAHTKNEYGANLEVIDKTFDGWKKLDYVFDLVFEIKYAAPNRLGVVRKSRVTGFDVGSKFDFSYEEIKKRYGGDLLEKACEEIKLITPENASKIRDLVAIKNVDNDTVLKWLEKADVKYCEEFTEEQGNAILGWLEKR